MPKLTLVTSTGPHARHRKRRAIHRARMIAPRLADGSIRHPFGHGLPPETFATLRYIAHIEGKSIAWVVEQMTHDYFGMKAPEYRNPTTVNPKALHQLPTLHRKQKARA